MNVIKKYNNMVEASNNVGIHKNNIWRVIKGLRKTAGGFIWKYLD